jgi:hypothetical protein
MISVGSFRDRSAAEVAKAELAASGIEAVVAADDAAGWQPALPFARGVRLLVHPDDAAEAMRLLSETADDAGGT